MIGKMSSDLVPRPSMVDDEQLAIGHSHNGQPSLMTFYVKVLELLEILVDVIENASLLSQGLEYFTSRDPYHVLFGGSNIDVFVETLKLDQSMTAWAWSLPEHLNVGNLNSVAQGENLIFRRQAHVLRSIYLHTRILLFRPILFCFCLGPAKQSQTISNSRADSWVNSQDSDLLPDHLALACAKLALRAAHDAIDHIYSHLDKMNVAGPVAQWWFCLLFTYSAATVLQAARLRALPSLDEHNRHDNQSAWDHALEIIHAFDPLSPHAERCAFALETISDRVGQAITPAKVTAAAASDVVDPDLATAATSATTGAGASTDDFDLSDIGWLMSAPTDL